MLVRIREVEKSLFEYLFCNKVATSLQISRDIWRDTISHQALYKRLNLLVKAKYICAAFHRECGGRLIYSLQPKALKEFGLVETKLPRQQLKSDSVLHDLALVDIKQCLKMTLNVQGYFSENEIRSGIAGSEDPTLESFQKYNFDAVLKLNRNNQNYFLPLEYERSLKFDHRYAQYFKKIYSDDQISAVLFVAKNQRLLTRVQTLDQKMASNAWPKVFYILEKDLFAESQSFYFENLNKERITFSRLQCSSSLQPDEEMKNAL